MFILLTIWTVLVVLPVLLTLPRIHPIFRNKAAIRIVKLVGYPWVVYLAYTFIHWSVLPITLTILAIYGIIRIYRWEQEFQKVRKERRY